VHLFEGLQRLYSFASAYYCLPFVRVWGPGTLLLQLPRLCSAYVPGSGFGVWSGPDAGNQRRMCGCDAGHAVRGCVRLDFLRLYPPLEVFIFAFTSVYIYICVHILEIHV
jgi:hypothetical protein